MFYAVCTSIMTSCPPKYCYEVFEDETLLPMYKDEVVDMTKENESLKDLLKRLFTIKGIWSVTVHKKSGGVEAYSYTDFVKDFGE